MTVEIFVTLMILVAAVVLFASEKLDVDLVALSVMAALLAAGIIDAEEGIAGFSNTATVTVACMFVLSAGLARTGAVARTGRILGSLARRSVWLALLTAMISVGVMSAFINNTAAVAIFLPIALAVARDSETSPSKWLMPISFASMFGGVCTLIGTSTNILVSSIAETHGQDPFGMFEFTRLGLIVFGVGILYMITIGVRLIPERRNVGDLMDSYAMTNYITEIVLLPSAKSVGMALRDSPLGRDFDLAIVQVRRDSLPVLPSADTVLQAGDQLLIRTSVEKIKKLQESGGIRLKPSTQWRDVDVESDELVMVEVVVAPNSRLNGRSLKQTSFRTHFGAVVLAVRHHSQIVREHLATLEMQAGDVLLIEIRKVQLARLRQSQEFVVVSEIGAPEYRPHKIVPAVLIIAGVVIAAALQLFPIVVGALIGCVLLVLTGCISLSEAYESIEWRVIFLLAGVLTLGTAMEKTGAAMLISTWVLDFFGAWGPVALLSAFYVLTSLLTQAISNAATVVLLAPIAIATAEAQGLNVRPFLVAVTFAASASFMTPVGYQTNTLIYGPGQYRFRDFVRVGTPLNIMFWLLATWLIPWIWPL